MSAPESSLISTKRGIDLSALYEIESGLCGLVLFVPIAESPDQAEPTLVTERRIILGPSFGHRDSREQAFLIAHALLHFSLKHPARGRQAAVRDSQAFREDVWTVAADAIVNDALAKVATLKMARDEWTMEHLMKLVPAARTLSLEQLYTALCELTHGHDDQLSVLTCKTGRGKGLRIDMMIDEQDVSDNGIAADDASPEEWRERLKRGFGRYPAGFERLLGHLPQTKTRWEDALRSLVTQAIGERENVDPSRPHRRWLALHRPLRSKGVVLPMMPGVRPQPQPRIALAIDTSASIDTKLLARFLAEGAAIMRQTGAAVRLITADAAVHQVQDFRRADDLLKFVPAGGGGTNFDPAIDAADEYRPSVLVYFTDLEAPTPRKPRYPVIWAVPATAAIPNHPYGRRLDLR